MSGTLKLNDTVFATENNGAITTDASTIKVGGTTVVDSNRVVDASEMKIGGNTVIDSNRAMDVSEVKVGGTTVVDSNRKMTGVDIVPTSSMMFRNKIINGDMRIDQRFAGNATGAITGSKYTIDRWTVRNATTVQQSTDVPADLGFKNSLFYDNDGTRTALNIRQPIEDAATLFTNKSCTLSFYLKASSACTISVDFCDKNTTNIDVTTSWDRYSVTFPAASSLNPSNIFVAGAGWIDFNLGSSYPDVYITGIQFEEGTLATPFEHRPYGLELSLCQRYYEKSFSINTAPANDTGETSVVYTQIQSGYGMKFPVTFKTRKRAAGASTIIYNPYNTTPFRAALAAGTNNAFTNTVAGHITETGFTVTAYSNPVAIPDYTGNPVSFNWTAESEL